MHLAGDLTQLRGFVGVHGEGLFDHNVAARRQRLPDDGVVRLGAPELLGSVLVAPHVQGLVSANPELHLDLLLLPRFAKANPQVVLDVTMADHTPDLVGEGYDVGIFIGLQKFDEAVAQFRQAIALQPENPEMRSVPVKPWSSSATSARAPSSRVRSMSRMAPPLAETAIDVVFSSWISTV